MDDEAGQALSDMYIENEQHSQAVSLYRDVTSQSMAGGKAKARYQYNYYAFLLCLFIMPYYYAFFIID